MVDYVGEIAVKKSCKYGDYGSFDQLLFLLYGICHLPRKFIFNKLFDTILYQASSSCDGTVQVWSADDQSEVKTLQVIDKCNDVR